MLGNGHSGEAKHEIGKHGSCACADDLHNDVRGNIAAINTAKPSVYGGDDGIEMCSAQWPKDRNQDDEYTAGGNRVFEQLEPNIVGGKALRHDPRADNSCYEKTCAERFSK
jgi:hypothetical protein